MPQKPATVSQSNSQSIGRGKSFTEDRRSFPRVPAEKLTAYIERERFLPFTAAVKDVSRAGICLIAPYPLMQFEIFMLHIDFGAGILRIKCAVARCEKAADGDRYIIGAQFVQIHRGKFDTVDYERDVDQDHVNEVERRLGDSPVQ